MTDVHAKRIVSTQPYELRFTNLVYHTLMKEKSTDDLSLTTLALICNFQQNAFLAAKSGDVIFQQEIAEVERDIHDIIEPALGMNKQQFKQMRIRKGLLNVQKVHDRLAYLWSK